MTYSIQQHQDEELYEYEHFVGAYFNQVMDCAVIYYRNAIRRPEGIINVIAISPDRTYLIHCKPFQNSSISEQYAFNADEVNQLCGEAKVFLSKFPNAQNITPVIISSKDSLSIDAMFAVKVHDVMKMNLRYAKHESESEKTLSGNGFTTTLPLAHGEGEETAPQNQMDALVMRQIEEVQYRKPFRLKDCARNIVLAIWFSFFESVMTIVLVAFDMHIYALVGTVLLSLSIFISAFFSKGLLYDKTSHEPKLYRVAINAIGCYSLIPLGGIFALYGIDALIITNLMPLIYGLPFVVPCMGVAVLYHATYKFIIKKMS